MFVQVKSIVTYNTNPKLYQLGCYTRFPLTRPGRFLGLALTVDIHRVK